MFIEINDSNGEKRSAIVKVRMKNLLITTLVLGISTSGPISAGEMTIAKNIKTDLKTKIERDLSLLDSFKFKQPATLATLKVMGLESLNAETATNWLNQRVKHIVSEKALSLFNLVVRRVIYTENSNVEYPNKDLLPYSSDKTTGEISDGLESKEAVTVMSNIGAAIYYSGKTSGKQYGLKISNGFLKRPERVDVLSPRSGIIQIGEGLFSNDLTINRENPDAVANSIFRLGTFFHEARHSDGNGTSLSFMHVICPKGHDYEGMPACDENLNGPYTIGQMMMTEMAKSCEDNCGEQDKQMLKIVILDSANRVLGTTHKGERSKEWDARPESL